MLHLSHLSVLVFCAVAWVLQFVLCLLGLYHFVPGEQAWPWALRWAMMVDFVLGAAILVLLVRALYWHPRSKAQVVAAVRKERERIARELHDQIGSQIVNAMMLIDAPSQHAHPVMQTLEQCMLDLRLLVEVMSDHKGNLADKLASLRQRLQPVLDKRGVQLLWNIEVPEPESLPRGNRARELCRLVQEAVSNVLQHSRATQLRIELRPHAEGREGDWLLRVQDNGVGMHSTVRTGYVGRGLEHMKRRAIRAGSTLDIDSPGGVGTSVSAVFGPRDDKGSGSGLPTLI